MRRCYIVVRQVFFMSGSTHYQCAQDNPVVVVFTTYEAAKHAACRIISNFVGNSVDTFHMVEQVVDSELIYKVGAFDSYGNCVRSCSVIKQDLLL